MLCIKRLTTVHREAIEATHQLQLTRLREISLSEKGRLNFENGPNTKSNGLYWIYSSYTDEELSESKPCEKAGSIDFSAMITRHHALNNVCKIEADGFRLVYNGIGGVGPKGHGGLRERILEEFRGGNGTGSLAICGSSLNDLVRWRVSHVLWSEIPFATSQEYRLFSEGFERLWRIHYGWPVLCTK